METIDDVMLDAEDKMEKSTNVLVDQFAGIRTGKASPALVENIQVEYYGALTRLKEMAGISTPEPRLIVITAYDPSVLPEIEKSILAANLGVTPINDGRLIRIPIPELNEERRKEMLKLAKRMVEDSRVAVRNVRRDANDAVKNLQKDGKITEDERDTALDDIQECTDNAIKKIDDALKDKETEIMEV